MLEIKSSYKTPQSLLDAISKAGERKITAEEIYQQRVSFIMGSLGHKNKLTRKQVEEILARQEGRDVGPVE